MTNAANGVQFDFFGDGKFIQMAWTDPAYGNAWLALDRNGNGQIDNGTKLFGNITPQPKSSDANGYLALAEYNKPENGGNGDGFIDSHDAIFPKLLLWVDVNHNGISEPDELHSLPELGVSRVDLQYFKSSRTDHYGNVFRYKARVWDAQGKQGDKWTWDVFLTAESEPKTSKN